MYVSFFAATFDMGGPRYHSGYGTALEIGRSLVQSQMASLEFFIDINPSDRNMALGSTQPLTEMSTGTISWGKCGRSIRLTTLPPSCAVVTKSGKINFLEHSGPPQACNGTASPLPLLEM
jgi:hypothetical protein